MRKFIIGFLLIIMIVACSGKRGLVKVETKSADQVQVDSVEYELITFDIKFETWYDMNDSPALYRSQEYYESWNKRYVSAWNFKTSHDAFFEPIIGYDYSTDYGFELNHRLFYYFQYVEKVLKRPILDGAKPNIMLTN